MVQEMSERLRNEEILRNISCGIYKIVEKRKGKSQIWCVFGEIQKEDGSYVEELVYCQECHHLLKFHGKQTSNLVRHKCYFKRRHEFEAELASNSDGQEEDKNAKKYKFKGFSLKQLGPKEKESVIEACSQWETEDCQQFSTPFDSEGFRKLVQTFIKLGAKHGANVDLQNIFADSGDKTISSSIYTLPSESPTNIKQDLERSSEDDNNQTCMGFSQENESEMEFSRCSTDLLTSTFARPLSTPLTTSLDTSLDTSFNAQKRSLQPPKLTYLTKVPRLEEPKRISEERSNIAQLTITTNNELPTPAPMPTVVNEIDRSADGCAIFGDHIACKMRQYSIRTRNVAQHHINNILFDADMGKYEA